MAKLDQAYITHCTFNTSFFHQEPLDRGGDRTYEYTTRAGSFDRSQGLAFYQKFRSVAYYRNYRPTGASDDDLRKRTSADFPVRFAFLPDMGGNDLVIHACYRGCDTSKSRRAQSFFVHMLFQERTKAKTHSLLTTRQVLPLWKANSWVVEDSDELTLTLPSYGQVADFAAPATELFERTLRSFVTAPENELITDPCGLIPARWAQESVNARQNLIRAVLRAYLGVATQNRVSLIIAAEPEFVAFLCFAVARLMPQKGFAANLSFSTFELTTESFFPCKLVGTTSASPDETEFQNRTGGPVLNTFSVASLKSGMDLVGKETEFEKSIFDNIRLRPDEWLSRTDEDLQHIENAAPLSPADLDPALDSARTIRALLHPRENVDVALPESKEQRVYIARTVAPQISDLFQGNSLSIIQQQTTLFGTYLECLEETNQALSLAASRELGQVLNDDDAIKLCRNVLLNGSTRLDILTAFLENREKCYVGLSEKIPPGKPLFHGSSPVVQEVFGRITPAKIGLLIRSIFHNSKSAETILLLATSLVASTRSPSEKQKALQFLVALWAKEKTIRVSARGIENTPESQIADLLLHCVQQVPCEEKTQFISNHKSVYADSFDLSNSIGEIFKLLINAAEANEELRAQVRKALRRIRRPDDPRFSSFLDRVTVIRAFVLCLESSDPIIDYISGCCSLMAELKDSVEKLLHHRHLSPNSITKRSHTKKLKELTVQVIHDVREVIEHHLAADGIGYCSDGKDAAAAIALANIFFAGLDPAEVTRELNLVPAKNSGWGKLTSSDVHAKSSRSAASTSSRGKSRIRDKKRDDAGRLWKLGRFFLSKWFLFAVFVVLLISGGLIWYDEAIKTVKEVISGLPSLPERMRSTTK